MNRAEATKKRTTLAALDKEVCARHGTHAAANGSRSRSASLGKDVLAQIDLLKGKSSRKRGLFALLHPPAHGIKPGLATARAYDVGAPIRVSGAYSGAFAASLSADNGSWDSAAAQDDAGESITAFAVEVFEEEAAPSPQRGWSPSAPAPVSTAERSVAPAAPIEVPVATALSRGLEEDGMLGLDLSAATAKDGADDADQFEREIQAILARKTMRPAKPPSAMAGSPEQTAVTEPAPRPHDIFEQMGRNMAYATAFNLPPMELGKRFDEIEREIVREEADDARRPHAALSLDLTDDDISASLGVPRALTTSGVEQATAPASPIPASPPINGDAPAQQPNAAPVSATPEALPPAVLPAEGSASPAAPPPAPAVTAVPAVQPADTGRPLP